MKFFIKGQISIVEFSFAMMILGLAIGYIGVDYFINSNDNKYAVNSLADTIYQTDEFRNLIMIEDIGDTAINGDWSNLSTILENGIGSYEFIISNSTVNKKIFTCTETTTKYLTQRIIAIKNNTEFGFRQIMLGVCY